MTDAEIKKALECCATDTCFTNSCPFEDESDGFDISKCTSSLSRIALDLINRQQADKEALIAGQETLQKALAEKNAEIERLKFITTNNPYCVSIGTADIFTANHEEYEQLLANIKAEATKEFAERLKKELINCPKIDIGGYTYFPIGFSCIDNLVKEMVGDAE